jgi:hypothetical protein
VLRDKLRALLAELCPEDLASAESREAVLARSPHCRTYGGNTSCVEVSFGDQVFVLDAGTGIRELGVQLARDGRLKTHSINLFFTHFHWDHICGFPFFPAIYIPGRPIGVWSGRSDAARLLSLQMGDAHFPVKWNNLPSQITCTQIPEDGHVQVTDMRIGLASLTTGTADRSRRACLPVLHGRTAPRLHTRLTL